jgi:pyruvate oxidase
MLARILDLFRGRSVVIRDASKLPEGYAKRIDLGDPLAGCKSIVLCRVEGQLHALDVRCPHEGGRISEGPLVEGKHARCPLHNFTFDPRNGAVVTGHGGKARVYRVREEGGDARVWA